MKKIKGNLFSFLGTFIFGLNFVSMKFLVGVIEVRTIIFLRFAIAGLFLFLILFLSGKKLKIDNKKDLGQLLLTAFLGMSLYYIFFTYSLTFISASLSSLICSMIPIFTLFINSIVKKKPLSKQTLILFLISIFGVYLVVDVSLTAASFLNIIKGIALMSTAVIIWIIYTIKAEYLVNKYDCMVVIAYQSTLGSILSLLFALNQIKNLKNILEYANLNLIILNIIFVSIIATALGYYFFNLGIKYIGVTISSIYMNTIPAVTMTASYFLLDSLLSYKKVTGIIIVIIITIMVAVKDKAVPKKIC